MDLQKIKVEYEDGDSIYFRDYAFKQAEEEVNAFLKRNRGKYNFKIYTLNTSPFGERWRFYCRYSKKDTHKVF